MALLASGSISASQINAELGRSATATLSWSDATFRKLVDQPSGTVDMERARGTAYVNSTIQNVNLHGLLGSPGVVRTYRVVLDSSAVVGGTYGQNAINIGQFPGGSAIYLHNYGNVLGYGGQGGGWYSGGASGGDAVYANYTNQTVTINNFAGAVIYAGGGGGGSGGGGGTGGSGGGGYYVVAYTAVNYQFDYRPSDASRNFYWLQDGDFVLGIWNRRVFGEEYAEGSSGWGIGYYYKGYYKGAYRMQGVEADGYGNPYYFDAHEIGQGYTAYYNQYTSGGGGAGGGAGGAGGRGQGADGANAAGAGGDAGNGGAGGGINAGNGGSGGYGGTGGTGGTWGAAGNTGSSGATGNTGGGGNNGGGTSGSAGGGGAGGGSAGRYLVKGSNLVTLNNSGSLAGGLA